MIEKGDFVLCKQSSSELFADQVYEVVRVDGTRLSLKGCEFVWQASRFEKVGSMTKQSRITINRECEPCEPPVKELVLDMQPKGDDIIDHIKFIAVPSNGMGEAYMNINVHKRNDKGKVGVIDERVSLHMPELDEFMDGLRAIVDRTKTGRRCTCSCGCH